MKRTLSFLGGTFLALAVFAQAAFVDGEVAKVDKAAGKLTLKHGGIKALDMPSMSMSFRVADPKWLDNLAAGQKVQFVAEKVNGQYTVTQLKK